MEKTTVHSWDSGTIISEPTCAATGSKKYVCTVCATIKTESIASSTPIVHRIEQAKRDIQAGKQVDVDAIIKELKPEILKHSGLEYDVMVEDLLELQQMAKETRVIGVWDDHDFGINDGNGNYADKEISKKYFLDFLDVPSNHHRRQKGKGIYATYSFGKGYKTVRIILLDVRFHKTSYVLNFNQDMLGEEQWKWLEKILTESKETFTFIASGTQILPFNRFVTEAWYQKSRKRLFNLIAKTKRNGVILLSGDVHFAQILKTFCIMPEIGYDLYELTSSGLSHYLNVSYYIDEILPNN